MPSAFVVSASDKGGAASILSPREGTMRVPGLAIGCGLLLMSRLFVPALAAQNLPACNTQLMTRNGNQITVGLQQLNDLFNRKLRAAHSKFTDLQLADQGGNRLKISGKNNGTPMSISGPLQAANGAVKLHADHIVRNGSHEKGLMDLFGKDLADYANFKKTSSLSAKGNDLYLHPDPLLKVSGAVTAVSLDKAGITLKFASQPCR